MNKLANTLRSCNKAVNCSARSFNYLIKSTQPSLNYRIQPFSFVFKSNFHKSSFVFNNKPNVDEQPVSGEHEKIVGSSQKFEFLAETKQLLNIVAKSLYSEKEVFVRLVVLFLSFTMH